MTDRCIIDIGSDIYDLTKNPDVKLFSKGITEFNKAFPIGSSNLLCKYFKYQNPTYTNIDAEDIDKVLKILEDREKNLSSALAINSKSEIAKVLTNRYLNNIREIIFKIKTSGEEPAIVEKKADISKDTLALKSELINDDTKFNLLLKIAWYMLHDDKISADGKKKWLAFIGEVKKNTEKIVIDNIGETLKEKTGQVISPLNYFERMKLTDVVTKDTLTDTFETAKQKIIEDLRSQEVDKLTNRLQGILAILQLHGYLEGKQVKDILDDATYITGLSNEIISNMGYSLVPIFYYFKKVYDPAYSFINTVVKENKDIPIDDLLHLVALGNYATSTPIQGIVRIENVPDKVITFLKKFNDKLNEIVSEEVGSATKKQTMYQQLLSLPIMKKDSIPKSVIRRIDRINIIGFYTKDQIELPTQEEYRTGETNVINKFKQSNPLKKAQEEKILETFSYTDTYRALTSFFNEKENNLYMMIGQFDDFPKNIPNIYFTQDFNSETFNPSSISNAFSYYNFSLDNVVKKLNYYINTPIISMMSLIAFNNQLPGVSKEIERIELEEAEEKRIRDEEEAKKQIVSKEEKEKSEQTIQSAIESQRKIAESVKKVQELKPKGILKKDSSK